MRHYETTIIIASLALAGALAGPARAEMPAQGDSAKFHDNGTVNVYAHPLTPANAPADRYFGRLKLSNLGIRNIIHALAVEGNSPLALPMERTRIMGVETAIVDWSDQFPRDSWLRGVVLNFATVIAQKQDVDTDRIAVGLLLRAAQRYPNTSYEKTVLARANGIAPSSTIDWSVPPVDPPTVGDLVDLDVGRL